MGSHKQPHNDNKKLVVLLLMTISEIYGQEVQVPERYLRPRTYNPHPYAADAGLRDYSIEYESQGEPETHPSLDQHPYPLFQRIDTRNNDNSPVQFPDVPQVLKKSLKGKPTAKFIHVPKNYAFSYAVRDHQSGDDFSHSQAHDGKATQGEYRVKLPDGRIQVVSYTADNKGYRADVRYDGEKTENKNVYSNPPLPYPHPVPGYISTLYNKKVPKISPTTPTFLVYTPDAGYRAAPAPAKYKAPSAPTQLQKISPTISTDGSLGYQQPVYYNTYNEVQNSQPPDIKYVNSDNILQSITAKYLQEVLPNQDHHVKSAPSLRDYASIRKIPPTPVPIYQAVVSTTPAPQVVEDENSRGGIDYSSELHSTVSPTQNIYSPSSTAAPVYAEYFALPTAQTSQKAVSPSVRYIYVPAAQYETYKQR